MTTRSLSTDTIKEALNTLFSLESKRPWIGKSLFLYPSIDSTNTEAMRQLEKGASDGTVFLATHQTHGKGRLGRTWVTPPHTSLACSLLLRPEAVSFPLSLLTHLTAAALHQTIATYAPVQLKWPNDVVINNKKMAGILIETRYTGAHLDGIVIGVGINVFPHEFKEATLDQTAISLAEVTSQPIDFNSLIATFLAQFQRMYDALLQDGTRDFLHICKTHSSILGQSIYVLTHSSRRIAYAYDLTDQGELIVQYEQDTKQQVLQTGEVSIRSRESYT